MDRPKIYNIYMLGRFAVCPKCKGTVRELHGDFLQCFDCMSIFSLLDDEEQYRYLSSDRELVVKEMPLKQSRG